MIFAEWIKRPENERVFLIEIRVGCEIEGRVWTREGATSVWWCEFSDGEVVAIKENGNPYVRKSSVQEVVTTPSSFYWSPHNLRLYLRTSSGESPDTKIGGEYKFCLITYFWLGFTNAQYGVKEIAYIPQDCSNEIYYLPYFDVSSLPSFSQAVGEYWIGSITHQFGSICFLNDGWWYEAIRNYIWHNKRIVIKIGIKDSQYVDFETIFSGRCTQPSVKDEVVTFNIEDFRVTDFREIPTEIFTRAQYPGIDDSVEGKKIPILFGRVENVTPVKIGERRYKVSKGPIEAILNVYADGELLTHYNADLSKGEFEVPEGYQDRVVTCSAKGVKISYFGAPASYSENVADILYYVLHELNQISQVNIDKNSFDDLRSARVQQLGWYLDTPMHTIDFIRMLQATSVFQLLPLPDGRYGAFRYKEGVSADTPYLFDEDYETISKDEDTKGIFRQVEVKYAYNPTTAQWSAVLTKEPKVEFRYDSAEVLTVETMLRVRAEAEALTKFYSYLVRSPGAKVSGVVPTRLLNLKPTDKVVVSKTAVGLDGEEHRVFEQEVYRVLSLTKNLATGSVEIVGVLDALSIGEAHADTSHLDAHEDSYSDEAHADVPHSDVSHSNISHQDVPHSNVAHSNVSHSNVAHSDVSHSNVAHSDVSHSNVAHQDVSHADAPHSNVSHSDSPHSNVSHSNIAHSNVPHTDVPHSDAGHSNISHSDASHSDAHSDTHSDTHEDWHSDTPHTDAHFDVPHSDGGHMDYHVDDYSDTPHSDEWHIDTYIDLHTDQWNGEHMDWHTDEHYDHPHSDFPHGDYHEDYHEDQPHGDSAHVDSHSDTSHRDWHLDEHNDTHTDSHSDVPHSNVAHSDTPHSDSPHSDSSHFDSPHSDSPHSDSPHSNVAHQNVSHSDTPHSDVSHSDAGHSDGPHSDSPHSNVAHSDSPHSDSPHSDTPHSDVSHSDVPHSDVLHSDISHQDVSHLNSPHSDAHGDAPHSDAHSDTHSDTPHSDSSY